VGDEVYFIAQSTGLLDREVFKTDGTGLGTSIVTDFPSGPFQSGTPLWLHEANGQAFFSAPAAGEGYEVWTTDGSFNSETLYAVFNPGPGDSNVQELVGFAGGIVCAAKNSTYGVEAWFSAGTTNSTFLLTDAFAGATDGSPQEFAVIGNRVYFSADELFTGREIWSTDGSPAGSGLVADLAQPELDGSSFPREFISLGDRALFVADDGVHGDEIWVSDGTAGGTELVFDISPDPTDSGPRELFAFNDGAIFPADDEVNGKQLWFSDGTSGGTYRVTDINSGPSGANPFIVAIFEGWAYFIAQTTSFNYDLYRTDGTPGGVQFVSAIGVDWGLNDQNAIEYDGWLYFAADDGISGTELWRLRGDTVEQVVDLAPGSDSGVPVLRAAVYQGQLYFAGDDGSTGNELFRTDGSAQGTALVADIDPTNNSFPRFLVEANDRLLFQASPDNQERLYSYDGQALTALTDSTVEFSSFSPLFSNGELAMAIISVPGTFQMLIGSDGTPAGTGPILPITNSTAAATIVRVFDVTSGNKRYFSAGDASFGAELWVTDGTTAGTQRLTDINPGPLSSSIEDVGRFGDELWFYARQDPIGFELWTLPIVDGDHVAEPFGQGCAGSSGAVPTIGVSGDVTLGSSLSIEIADAAPSSIAAHFSSLPFGLSQVSGCSLYLADPILMLLTPTGANGRTSVPVVVPDEPALVGLNLWWQTLIADPGGALGGTGALTPALEVWIGS
ncbi:MAG: hypothetical protein AAFZ65_13230, partial [Planctomycetota bacterium]